MLDWCLDYMKKEHTGFKFNKAHLMFCADALNKFGMGVTVDQVDRHYRYHKENWKIIERAMNNSGNTFDEVRCMVNISESEKATLSKRTVNLLAKPIKHFNEIRELFMGCNADGSLAMDQNTCTYGGDGSDSDESRELFDLNCYTHPEDLEASRKRPRGKHSPTKRAKSKSHFADSTDEITGTMKSLQETLAATARPQMPQLTDPHKALRQRLEAIPMTPDQRVLVGEHLSTKENKGKRGWLCNASADTLHAWVFKFLCDKEGINL
ncbi:hypothetical protein PVAP13_5KG246300 [Panicum virgatum]|uniref:Myb/SANT-like domain-containing protein n=1 Tax=Panicum virgatum TaxID=38727 RepID=A0A8T0SIC1_PANVG|nr:hypothetical protein PVAP13_5KG246300 [Panicum virgatum]